MSKALQIFAEMLFMKVSNRSGWDTLAPFLQEALLHQEVFATLRSRPRTSDLSVEYMNAVLEETMRYASSKQVRFDRIKAHTLANARSGKSSYEGLNTEDIAFYNRALMYGLNDEPRNET